jgi:hypothetical protein
MFPSNCSLGPEPFRCSLNFRQPKPLRPCAPREWKMPAQKDTVIPRASCFARGICCFFGLSRSKQQQIPRSAAGPSYSKRIAAERGMTVISVTDSNLIIDSVELTNWFIGARFLREGPPAMRRHLCSVSALPRNDVKKPQMRRSSPRYRRRSFAALRMTELGWIAGSQS